MTDTPEIVTPPAPTPKATLSDLECASITAIITLADDAEVAVPIKLIPQSRMLQLSAMIPQPQPPVNDAHRNSEGVVTFVKNYADSAYLAALSDATFKRNSLMLAEMVQVELPGETLEARAEYIREKFDPLVTDQLIGVVSIQREKVKARIITRAETFHG